METPSSDIPQSGSMAPSFSTQAHDGKMISLDQWKNQYVVLYFYPKDDTPGCTAEACSFRDHIKEFENKRAVVVGVSPDSPKSHQKFIEKYQLPFTLISDENHEVCMAYGVWQQKSMYGKTYMGVERTTFLIAPGGKIERIFNKVKPAEHIAEVLATLR